MEASTAAQFSADIYKLRPMAARISDVYTRGNSGTLWDRFDFDNAIKIEGLSGFASGVERGFGLLVERKEAARRGDWVLACRGTYTGSHFDGVTDAKITFSPGPGGYHVHSGFKQVFRSMIGQVAAKLGAADFNRLDITGHSLGGGIATLFAMHYGQNKPGRVGLYTFGSPRVGGQAFSRALRTVVAEGSLRRVYGVADPVPMVPLWPFHHHDRGETAIYERQGSISFSAHDITKTYLATMNKEGGWPVLRSDPTKGDVSYWLGQIGKNSKMMSSNTLGYLGKALGALIVKILGVGVVQPAIMGLVSVVDQLAYILQTGLKVPETEEETSSWIMSALKWTGRVIVRTVSAPFKITLDVVRYVLQMFLSVLNTAATAALFAMNRLSSA